METGSIDNAGPDVLAEWLRTRLDSLEWTQKQLADRAGISTSSISELLNGRQAITAETAEKLASVFELRATAPQLLQIAGALRTTYIEPSKRELAVNMFLALPADKQELVLDFMNMLRSREREQVEHSRRKRKTPGV